MVLLIAAEEDTLVPLGDGRQEDLLLAVDQRRVDVDDEDHHVLVDVLVDGVDQLFAAVSIAGVKV